MRANVWPKRPKRWRLPLRLLPAGRFLHSRIPALGNTLFSICCELKNFQEKREVMRLGALALLQSPVLKSIAAHSASLPGLDFSLHFEGVPPSVMRCFPANWTAPWCFTSIFCPRWRKYRSFPPPWCWWLRLLWCGIWNPAPRRVHVASPVAALEAVRLGLGAAIVCEHALPEDMSGLQRYELAGMLPPRRVVLALAPQHGLAGKQREFLDLLRKQWA